MDSRLLSPIPTPPSQRWREIRLLYLPRTVFVLGAIAVAYLWNDSIAPATLIAEAEVAGADVRSPQPGILTDLRVATMQTVRAGEVIGHVSTANPRMLDATLAVIRAEVGMLAITMAGATDRQRVAMEAERMHLDWMAQRVELAAFKGRLQLAASELARAEPLHRAKLISEEAFDLLRINRETLAAQLAEQSKLVADSEPVLKLFARTPEDASKLTTESALAAALKVQEAKLKLAEAELMPVPLTAPIDGVVSALLRRAGEAVVPADVIVRITSAKSERISGYLRQPLAIDPKPGMTVQVRSRASSRQSATTKIIQVGPALEAIPLSLVAGMRLPPNVVPEPGLRIVLAMPAGLALRPGEQVDISLP
jgi:multidrug resistance efflux pump